MVGARNPRMPIDEVLTGMLPDAIRTMGGITGLGDLTCPALADDPGGVYRVGLDHDGRPEIQRRDAEGAWGRA